MLSLILKDRGSQFHSKITDEDVEIAKSELAELKIEPEVMKDLADELMEFLHTFAKDYEWFDINLLKNANKENLTKFFWLLARPYEIRLEKEGRLAKYGADVELTPSQKELQRFHKYFKTRDKIGTHFYYIWGGNWTRIFSSGFQLVRVILGPFGYVAGKIPFVALGFFLLWIAAAFFDWIALCIPYFVLQMSSGLPSDYYNTELLIGSFLFGNSTTLKETLRELVKNDKTHGDVYDMALWALFLREKMVEIVRKERNEL